MVVVTLLVLWLVGTIVLRASTFYIVENDRLLIQRVGAIWMDIPFEEIEELEPQPVFFLNKFRQIRMYQLVFRRLLRIRKRGGFFRYVLINPRDPAAIMAAVAEFKAGQHQA